MTIKLGDYCDVIKGTTGIKKAVPGDFPLVVTAEERLSHKEYQFDNKAIIIPLVSSTGHGHASIKRIHYQEGKFALGTILCAVIIKDTSIINPRFLYIYLSYFKDHLLVPLMKGAANVTLSIKRIKEVKITLPSLERQLEIIELEKNNHSIEELNDETRTQKSLLDQLKKAILQEAIQGKLTREWRTKNPELITGENSAAALFEKIKAEKAQLVKEKKIKKEKSLPPIEEEEIPFELPEGWVWCRLQDLFIFIDYRGKTPTKLKEGIRLLTAKNVREGYVNLHPEEFLSKSEYKERMTRGFPKNGDILFTTEAPLGNAALLDIEEKEISTGQRLITFQSPLDQFDNRSILNFILSPFFQNSLQEKSSGVTATGIKASRLRMVPFPLPPLHEQNAITEKIEVFMEKWNILEQEIIQSEKYAQMLMQAVLKEAFEEEETKKQQEEIV